MSGHARPDISESVVITDLRSPTRTRLVFVLFFSLYLLEFAEIPEYLRPRFFCLLLTNFQIRQSYAICQKLQISARFRQLRGGKGMQQECYISEAIQLFMITECLGVSGQQ